MQTTSKIAKTAPVYPTYPTGGKKKRNPDSAVRADIARVITRYLDRETLEPSAFHAAMEAKEALNKAQAAYDKALGRLALSGLADFSDFITADFSDFITENE